MTLPPARSKPASALRKWTRKSPPPSSPVRCRMPPATQFSRNSTGRCGRARMTMWVWNPRISWKKPSRAAGGWYSPPTVPISSNLTALRQLRNPSWKRQTWMCCIKRHRWNLRPATRFPSGSRSRPSSGSTPLPSPPKLLTRPKRRRKIPPEPLRKRPRKSRRPDNSCGGTGGASVSWLRFF